MTETGRTLGAYQLEDALGGTRTVFRARHLERGDVVCVKLLPEHLRLDAINRGRRKRELLATRQVQHSGVGRPLDFVDADGRLFLVMEYVEGAPLSMALFGGVTLPLSRALRVVRGACEAVAAAHAAHATHGCLEPDKVLLAPDGAIHVVGFGFRDEDALKHPGEDAPADVDLCTAPERWSGAFETPEADVWALGALLYRCLTGAYPFETDTRSELSHQVQASDALPPRFDAGSVEKPAIEAVVLRALSRDPSLRYPDAAVLARALLELEGMVPADSAPVGSAPADSAPTATVLDEGPLLIDADDVEPLFSDDDVPPPPPAEDDAVAALAGLEGAIQSHDAFADPFDGLVQGAEEPAPPLHPPIDDEDGPAEDERTFVERSGSGDATTVEAPSLDGTTVERPSVELPRHAVPGMEQPSTVQPSAPQPSAELLADELREVEGDALDALDDVELEEVDPADTSADVPIPPPLPEGMLDVLPPPLPADEERTLVTPRPGPVGAPEGAARERSRTGLYAAGLALALVAGAFAVLDPLGMWGEADAEPSSAAPAALAAAVTEGATESAATEPTEVPASDVQPGADDDGGAAADDDDDAGAVALADAEEADAPASDDEAVAEAEAKLEEEAEDTAPDTPKEAYEANEDTLAKLLEERGLLWKDDRTLDRLRLRARRQAKARRYQAAARTAGAAVETAAEVKIDDRLVKRKLLRYVKRRNQMRDSDVVKRARALETRARQHLKDDEHDEANELLNAGLRLMYRAGD